MELTIFILYSFHLFINKSNMQSGHLWSVKNKGKNSGNVTKGSNVSNVTKGSIVTKGCNVTKHGNITKGSNIARGGNMGNEPTKQLVNNKFNEDA